MEITTIPNLQSSFFMSYFNYRILPVSSRWDRRTFVHEWWRIYGRDRRWVSPYYPRLRWSLNPSQNSHLARLQPNFVRIEALPQRENPNRDDPDQAEFSPGMLEVTVATGVILQDGRRGDGSAYLALPHVVNDEESLARLLDHAAEELALTGCRRLIAPTGLSPHLGSGWLSDHWHLLPPIHTPYDPPYLPELVDKFFQPFGKCSYLYHLPVPAAPPTVPRKPADLIPLEPARLAGDLRPLLAAACENNFGFAPPDEDEAAFLLHWLDPAPLVGWLAQIDGLPAGFVLMQPDLAPLLHCTRGGRRWLGRLWLVMAKRWPARRGRLLFGAVLPQYRRQGIGWQLLQQVLLLAREQGWESITIGPLAADSAAVALLQSAEAQPQQTYQLYEQTL